ncbi:MAG: cupin domain-containing protein [Casimicrobiaceae bacterium]
MPGKTKVHAFNRSGVRLDKSLGDAAGMQRLGAHLVSVMPGYFSSEFHHHHFAEECVYVLAGEGRAHIGERIVALAPGDFVGYPANGVAHAIEATGSGPLVCLVVGERLAQDVIDYPRAGKRLVRDDAEGLLVARTLTADSGTRDR